LSLLFNHLRLAVAMPYKSAYNQAMGEEVIMQMAITFMAVVAGLIFSVAVALLAEELIFGQVSRLFFARLAVPVKTGQKR
jgi:hypothetical protein